MEKILNQTFCPEDPDIFKTTLTENNCFIEVRTLLIRVYRPLIIATLRWSHQSQDLRESAVEELNRGAPWVAFRICVSEQDGLVDTPFLSDVVKRF